MAYLLNKGCSYISSGKKLIDQSRQMNLVSRKQKSTYLFMSTVEKFILYFVTYVIITQSF